MWTPYAELVHHESASRGSDRVQSTQARFDREIAVMKDRWGEVIRHDPAYSPNLTLETDDFGYAWPPRVAD